MRIVQLVPRGEQPWSGVLTVIVHLAAALSRAGHHVEVWQLHRWDPEGYAEQRRRLGSAGVLEVSVPPSRRQGRAVASLTNERDIDVVHLHGAFNTTNTAVSRALTRPYVFSPHSGYDPVSLRRSRLRKSIYRVLFERRMLARAAMLVALTDVELGQLRAVGASGPAVVIPNGVEAAPDDADGGSFRRELRISSEVPLAVFVGRLDVHRKGLDVLVRGIADAPGWHAALVGPRFRDVDRLEAIVADLGVADRVHIVRERHGRRLQEVLDAADLFALLSRWEGLPMALLEALASATPAVVSPAVERVVGVEEAGAGWSVGETDLGPLLRRLQDDGTELRRRGGAARELSGRYDWDAVAERYETAYARALEGARG